MRTVRTYLVGGGATGALMGATLFFFVSLTAVLSHADWPHGLSGPSPSSIDIGGIGLPGAGGQPAPRGPETIAATADLGGAPAAVEIGGVASAAGAAVGGAEAAGGGSGGGSASGRDAGDGGRGPGGGGSGNGSPGASGGGDTAAPTPAPPPAPVSADDGTAASGASAGPATAGNSGKVPPGQAKKYAAQVAVAGDASSPAAPPASSSAPTAGNSGKVPPGQAKQQG